MGADPPARSQGNANHHLPWIELVEKSHASATKERLLAGFRPCLYIIGLGLLIYGSTVTFEFSYCDDYKNIIEERESLEGLSRIPSAFLESFGNFYRPVLRISYIIDHGIGGVAPWIYHLSNVLYHLTASCLVFAALLVLTRAKLASFLFAALFAAHPLLVVAVAWIPGRNDSLVTLFVLLSFLGLNRLHETKDPLWYPAHFAAFALALFTKEIAVLLPLPALGYLLGLKRERALSPRTLVLLAGWGVIVFSWFLLRRSALEGVSSPDTLGFEAFTANLPALPAVLGKMILPWKLSGLATFETASIAAGILLAAAGVLLAATTRGVDHRVVLFGASWFLLFFLPTLFYRVEHAGDHFDYMEHRAYLPMIGVLTALLEPLLRRGVRFERKSVLIIFGVILAVFSARGFTYGLDFRDRHTFWERAIENDPSRSNFHSVMGKLRYDQGNLEEAARCFERAIELSRLKDARNYYSLAGIYREMGRLEEALPLYEKAVEREPGNPLFLYRLAKAYYESGRMDAAETRLREALVLQPDHTDMLILLVGVHAANGRIDGAIETCRRILAIDARHFHACNILADLLSRQGRLDEAAEMWEKILRIRPDHIPALEQLMRYHLGAGRYREARFYAQELRKRGGKVPPEIEKSLNDRR